MHCGGAGLDEHPAVPSAAAAAAAVWPCNSAILRRLCQRPVARVAPLRLLLPASSELACCSRRPGTLGRQLTLDAFLEDVVHFEDMVEMRFGKGIHDENLPSRPVRRSCRPDGLEVS